jgi:hypothetical protein
MEVLLPFAYGLIVGDEERYGLLDDSGYFQETTEPHFAPPRRVARFGDSDLGLLLPCTAEILHVEQVQATLEVGIVDGRVACVGIKALPERELTGQLLRQVPLHSLVREVARNQIVHIRDGFAVRFIADDRLPEKPRRRVVDDAFLERVAEIYRQAVATGLSTQQEIQRQLGPVSDPSARRWVMQARRAGFLGPAIGTRAGEAHGSS